MPSSLRSSSVVPALVFALGLAVVGWIAVGYAGTNALALAVTLLIGACYVAGGLELYRYRQATSTLAGAVDMLAEPPPSLDDWLDRLDPSLRNAVRLRIEGERVALPVPALTPYLVGMLVLLGMLGTLLGMMLMLRGTGMALETATDLQAIRDSLAAPVKGLGFAFGTSIAGIATSAMLGLLSALLRRERTGAVQRLDAAAATVLRVHSQAHQREETLRLLQRQTEVMPVLVERLQAMMATIEQQSLAAGERLDARQDAFHGRTEAAYTQLAASVERTLQASVTESARAASAALQPVFETTMAALARETAALQATVADAVDRQLQALTAGFEASTTTVTGRWQQALDGQTASNETLAGNLRGALDAFNASFERRAGGLLDAVGARLDATATQADALQQTVSSAVERQLQTLTRGFEASTATVAERWQQALAAQQATHAALTDDLRGTLDGFGASFEQRAAALVDGVASRLDATASHVAGAWQQALSQQAAANDAFGRQQQQALAAAAATFESQSASLLRSVDQSHAQLQAALAERDGQRLAAWTDSLAAMGAALREDWAQAGAETTRQQQAIGETLATTADAIAAQTRAHASDTIAEISRLVDAASEAPRAAAEVIAELRRTLSDSMVRDTAMLEERTQMMSTLDTLLSAVNHASTEQRAAIDALVATSADLLERVGTRFTDHIAAETGKLDGVAAQLTAGAVDVASLGEAFGAAVAVFGDSNDRLAARLQGIEDALEKSLARSDEQLAYYVAQAREVVDLSVLAQKQIIEDLQQLGGRQADAA
ncbi:DUF802 domain-containing protein [Luteimonas sp. BDR2-5]|uniref:DUF802 domain-containing protein n=1 Tax=Proluteimonas luteida TaxID=2878685 RepID=UPI001E584AB1|nr:DUF802 domain-containing protein [Luteimonas sp. BDR2-5]MCD9029497.1 DUF802 domain-containing protein [Luteimonas sp. BDR2-5]